VAKITEHVKCDDAVTPEYFVLKFNPLSSHAAESFSQLC